MRIIARKETITLKITDEDDSDDSESLYPPQKTNNNTSQMKMIVKRIR